MSKAERRLNEFCAIGNLESHREILSIIFSKIDEANCRISTRDDGGPSIHEFPNERGHCQIRILLRTFAKNPVEAIWVILHEFGHHQSGMIDKKNLTKEVAIERENEAWDIARRELLQYSVLAVDILNFDNYAQKCLAGYYKKLNDS